MFNEDKSFRMSKLSILIAVLINLFFGGMTSAELHDIQIEKRILKYISSDDFGKFQADQRCHGQNNYRIYLIDNFEQYFNIIPGVRTSHGELLAKLLRSERNDIDVTILNTALGKGLAQVIDELVNGACIDAVISSIPGSNYTYDQVSSLLPDHVEINQENILTYRSSLKRMMRDIAFNGFPSVEWLEQVDVNTVKLRNDARKFAFIEALGQFNVPVILPYGNSDSTYKGKIKSVNLLSLASNAQAFSALNQKGERVPGFPYSPLSSGDEQAVYSVVECPHPEDPFRACLDINNDHYFDYTFVRTGKIPYHDDRGKISFSPPVLSREKFTALLAQIGNGASCRIDEEMVLTVRQYQEIKSICPADFDLNAFKSYVWLNSPEHGRFYSFEAQCRDRGKIRGTSVIPPIKVKEMLPPKKTRSK